MSEINSGYRPIQVSSGIISCYWV